MILVMYRTIADFAQDFDYERGMTRTLMENLTESSLGQAVRPGGRTLGKLAEHIIHTLVEMPGVAGLQLEEVPSTGPLAAQYAETAQRLQDAVAAQWTDAMLAEEVPMYGGEKWKRSQVLNALVKHEVHHRAQMTVLMRQAGLRVPGIYGPAQEEWAAMGMPPQE
jgi:uncharacterized damage-inducible protein DinB